MSFHYINNYCICNGSLEKTSLVIEESSSSLLVVYEVFRIMAGKPLFLDDHLQRMELSLSNLNVDYKSLNKEGIIEQLFLLCRKNDINQGNIELRAVVKSNTLSTIYLGFIPHNYPNPIDYINGVTTCLVKVSREKPNIKLKGSTAREIANQKIKENKSYEALLVNAEDFITEGSRSNVFFVKGNVVYTAPCDRVLEGISRKYVIKALTAMDIQVSLRMLHVDELETIEAAFICGTSPGVLPIKQINERLYNNAHPLLKQCMQGFNDEVVKYLND